MTVGDEHAEFDVSNPGTLTALVLDSVEQADVTLQATLASVSATHDVTIVASNVDVVGPTVAITDPTTEPAMLTEESTITINGTAEDTSGVMAVTWSTDRGSSGPCFGLVDWTTGPIRLTEGVTLITISAEDSLQNSAGVDLTVTYTIPEAPIDSEPPVDPEPPMAPGPTDPPVEPEPPAEDSGDATPVDPGGDQTLGDDPIEDTDSDPAPNGNDPGEPGFDAQPTTGCGFMGLINLPVLVLGLCAIRRWTTPACRSDL